MPVKDKARILAHIFGGDTPEERVRLIAELEREQKSPFVAVRLNAPQITALSEYIALLPLCDLRALVLYYCLNYTDKRLCKELKKEIGTGCIKGHREYLKDRLVQCMGLGRPITENCWRLACLKAIDITA